MANKPITFMEVKDMAIQKVNMKGLGTRYLVKSTKVSGGMLSFKNKTNADNFNRLIKKGY